MVAKFRYEPVAEIQELLKKQLIETEIPKISKFFDEKIKSNRKGYIIGDKLTFLDLKFYRVIESANNKGLTSQHLFLEYPSIKEWYNMIGNLPKIAKRITERPDYMY